MNINDTYNSAKANAMLSQIYSRQMGSAGIEGSKETEKLKKAFDQADIKLQQKAVTTQEQISAFGQLKSSFSDTQAASRDVQKIKTEASPTDMAAAANTLANAYNNTVKAATSVGAQSANTTEAIIARRAGTDLKRSVSDGGLATDLQKAGVSLNADGRIKIDADKFKAAAANDAAGVREALEKMGQKIEASSVRALAKNTSAMSEAYNKNTRFASPAERAAETLTLDREKFKSAAFANTNGVRAAPNEVSTPASATKKIDRSPETRRLEQQNFEIDLKKKYQSNVDSEQIYRMQSAILNQNSLSFSR